MKLIFEYTLWLIYFQWQRFFTVLPFTTDLNFVTMSLPEEDHVLN